MTDFHALCARMADELDHYRQLLMDDRRETHALAAEARAALAQPESVAQTSEELLRMAASAIDPYQNSGIAIGEYEAETECALEVYGSELIAFARAVLARWGHHANEPVPAEPAWADIHYAWELLDAEGEWQAGGSANSLDDVRREGNRYLQTYAQDGPHKLIIQRHCVNTIEEVTND